jgi:putative transposase
VSPDTAGIFVADVANPQTWNLYSYVMEIIEAWRREYNESRPHRALGERTPNEFANEIAASRDLIGFQTAENSP